MTVDSRTLTLTDDDGRTYRWRDLSEETMTAVYALLGETLDHYPTTIDAATEDDDARAALDAWRDHGAPLDDEHARRVAAWWHSPGNPDLSRFSHGIAVRVGDLRDAIEREIREEADNPEREELDALIGWCDTHGEEDTV